MKKHLNQLYFMLMERKETAQLVKTVDETLATGFYGSRHKAFSHADLWNIQKNKKQHAGRRFLV